MADNNNDSLIKWARTFVTKDIEKLIYEQPKLVSCNSLVMINYICAKIRKN